MKKYLMTGVAALAFAATFTSCSKTDLYDEGAVKEAETQKQTEQILASYNQAFLKTFGQPAPDQDWGFGTVTNAGTRSVTINGDVYDKFHYPTSEEIAAAFPADVVGNAIEVSTITDKWGTWSNDNNKNFQITSAGTVEVGGTYYNNDLAKIKNIYIKLPNKTDEVTITVNGLVYINFYAIKGTIKIINTSEFGGSVSISENAKWVCNSSWIKKSDSGYIKIYNKGEIDFTNDEIDLNNFCSLYNMKKVTAKDINYAPGAGQDSYFINMGDDASIEAKSMTLQSNSHFLNSGYVEIEGATSVTQAGCFWVNSGHYKTGSMIFSAGNATFYNYCNLIITGNAHMYDGEFNVMANSYTEAGTAEFDNFIVNMKSNSGFNVKGNSTWIAQGAGKYQGFKLDGEKAYVRLGGTTTIAQHQKTISIASGITYAINNWVLASGKTIEQLESEQSGDLPCFEFNGTKVKDFSKFTVTPKNFGEGCGAEWGEPESYDVCIIAEDLSATDATDYDFNDVVFEVKYTSATTATIQLKAAGGTLPLTVADNEVHAKFGYPDPDPITGKYKMINTGAKADVNGATAEPITVTNIDRSKRGKDIIIKVNKGTAENPNWIEMQANAGEPAAKLAVESGFEWCDERQPIATKYPEFPKYVKDKKVVWY